MGYLHIKNLYKDTAILLFRRCYALEKIHGTSSNISFCPKDDSIKYFSGGMSHVTFKSLFNEEALKTAFKNMALPVDKNIIVYGEAYGGKEQGMSGTYGKVAKFIVFDIQIAGSWLNVPVAEQIALSLNLEFVFYQETGTEIEVLDAARDRYSEQAVRNGVVTREDLLAGKGKKQEGVVLRPLQEMTMNNGDRVISKHKHPEFSETNTQRQVETDPAKLKVLADAQEIAEEWVTYNRLQHVLQKIEEPSIEKIPVILKAMAEDVAREGAGEFVPSKEVNKAISTRTVTLFKEYLDSQLHS